MDRHVNVAARCNGRAAHVPDHPGNADLGGRPDEDGAFPAGVPLALAGHQGLDKTRVQVPPDGVDHGPVDVEALDVLTWP